MRRARLVGPILLAVAATTAVAVLAAACGSSADSGSGGGSSATTAPAGELQGAWTLATYRADGTMVSAPSTPAQLTLAADGTYSGTTGCNGISGTWTGTAGEAVSVTVGPMTKVACTDEAVQAQEVALTTMLPEVAGAEVRDGALTLTDADGNTLLTFVAGPEGLVGSYTVTGVNDGASGVVSNADVEKATITFDEAGTVSGNTGCNSFTGSYTVDGDRVTVAGDVASTLMGCEPALADVEAQFLAALGKVATWERTGTQVTLRDASGATQLTLAAT